MKTIKEFAGKGLERPRAALKISGFLWRVSLPVITTFLLVVTLNPTFAYAQWPPFLFNIYPFYENGKITYNITFSNEADWAMTDVTIAMPIPAGTRFLESSAQANTQATFDGQNVTFFTSAFHQPIKNASFVVEVTNPALTVFTTHAWIAWKGEQPGSYLTEDSSFDITRPTLNWEPPAKPNLQIGLSAVVANNIITYNVYPKNVGPLRMWDLKINVPIPAGTTFVSAEAPPSFTSNFTGQEISFFVSELERGVTPAPLTFKVALTGTTSSLVSTHAWAAWKNAGSRVGRTIPPEEQMVSGDIIVQPYTFQQVYAEVSGDVPFGSYDLTSVALGPDDSSLKVIIYTADKLDPVGTPVRFSFYIDKDCHTDTGQKRNGLGRDYTVEYRRDKNRANLGIWNETEQKWGWQKAKFDTLADQKAVILWIPSNLLETSSQFCWQVVANNSSPAFSLPLPNDRTGIVQYDKIALTGIISATTTAGSAANTIFAISSTQTVTLPVASAISGKLAVPLDNGWAAYDVHVFSMPAGQEIMRIANARQPNFRADGQRLLVNQEGGGIENVFEYNLLDGTKRQVGDGPKDSHPYYDSGGNRVVFDNPELIIGANGVRDPFIFIQCGLIPPHLETQPRCHDIASLGVLVPAGQMGEIQGTHPVWTSNDMIAYKGCNTWAGARLCGIYIVPSSSTKGLGDGFIPRQLTSNTSDIPTDTRGNFITFTSQRDGNWEAYVMDLNGNGVRNLSNSPNSNDGLPAISPDGYWVAFVSDRGGQWAVWAVPIIGGDPQKLFDLPTKQPWGDGDRNWTNERISWGQ